MLERRLQAEAGERQLNPCEMYGLVSVRGAEIIEVKDEAGRLMNDFTGEPPTLSCVCAGLVTVHVMADVNPSA